MSVTHLQGDCRVVLRTLPERSVHCCVTSPPYWGLRDYGIPPTVWGGDGDCQHEWSIEDIKTEISGGNWAQQTNGRGEVQGTPAEFRAINAGRQQRGFCRKCEAWLGVFGMEPTPELFVQHGVEVFREVRRVLRDDGTLWLNIGDSYFGSGCGGDTGKSGLQGSTEHQDASKQIRSFRRDRACVGGIAHNRGTKPKDLVGVPWMLAFALRADGWYLRQDIIWHKPNPMPESVDDRCTKAHEYIFLLSKSSRYFYDAAAIYEPISPNTHARVSQDVANQIGSERAHAGGKTNGNMKAVIRSPKQAQSGSGTKNNQSFNDACVLKVSDRNKRSVWTVASKPYKGAHFAVFPPKLIEPCILAGTSAEGCCDRCGAPYVRETQKQRMATRPANDTKTTGDSMVEGNRDPKLHVTKTVTMGWRQGCRCEGSVPVPCTVLDPFGGSGTTGEVAQKCGCHAIMIELNEDYIALQKRRVEQRSLYV